MEWYGRQIKEVLRQDVVLIVSLPVESFEFGEGDEQEKDEGRL
jgi:hypothetical protein